MRKLLVVIAIGSFVPGCLGDVGGDGQVDPEAVVATFHLKADLQQALQSKECTDLHGVTGCTPYPNPMECESLVIQVRADGKTIADCRDRDGSVLLKEIDSIASIPFLCRANKDLSCQTCVDVFGSTVLDNCRPGRQSSLYRQAGSGWSALPPSSGFLEEPGVPGPGEPNPSNPSQPSTPTTPAPSTPSTKADACHYGNALILYAKELNKILAHEGLAFHWNPFTHAFPDPGSSQSFFNTKDKDLKLAASSNLSCQQYYASIKSKYKQCPNPQADGSCKFCWGVGTGPGLTCKASRINVAALLASCGKIPAACDQQLWSAAIVMAYGTSNKDLFQNTKSAFSAGASPDGTPTLPTPTNPSGTPTPGTPTTPGGGNEMPPNWPGTATPPIFPPNVVPPNWQGSPLVLDLAGDGVRPTSLAEGVRFELVGAGALRTAWIQGDDALLALDRNGNGAIDDGTELFGSVTAGRPWEDGFQALAELDSNQDGVIDARDPAWRQLRLWRDRDRSGTSSPAELVAPGALGIRSIGTRPHLVPGSLDTHGNDLGLRGSFTWEDGSTGLVVDVDFVTGR